MHHYRQGSGRPLVLLHGLGSRWQVWKPVLPRLTPHHDVIAVDLPGFGETPPDGGPGDVPHLADRVTAFLDDLGVSRPALGGSSLGGGVALELGRRGVARSVTVFSPVGFSGAAGARWCQGVVTAARAGGAALGPALPRLMRTRAGRAALCGVFYARPGGLDPGDCVADARALVAAPGFRSARNSLGRWRFPGGGDNGDGGNGDGGNGNNGNGNNGNGNGNNGNGNNGNGDRGDNDGLPVMVAWGSRDLVLPYRQAARARRLLPRARHVRLAGCGHLPFADDPEACARLLLESG